MKFPMGIGQLRRRVPEALEDGENELTPTARRLLRNLLDHLLALDVEIAEVTRLLVEQTEHTVHRVIA